MSARFVYALEPVRLQRSWSLDELRLQLAALNDKLAEQERCVEEISASIETNQQSWRAAASCSQGLQTGLLSAYAAYLGKLERELSHANTQLAEVREERAAHLALVLQATRQLDALEDHKAGEGKAFRSAQEKAALIEADDHWSILKNRSDNAREI